MHHKRQYPESTRFEAIALRKAGSTRICRIAKQLNVPYGTVYQWLQREGLVKPKRGPFVIVQAKPKVDWIRLVDLYLAGLRAGDSRAAKWLAMAVRG